ncbi:MAG: tRNA (guanine26-N2/guanine27-N2)-dimethyltransferase, partial [Thermoplasmata archaeon]|nr:tRNA (guanine26-N2/guanine27-N2)-dimethyltransferase [Thermoplasmata archaeon]
MTARATGLQEGATTLFPPATNLAVPLRAPGAREKGQPFFNPGMALNRDLSVLLVEAFARAKGREIDVADALAGTGARSLRLAKEVEAPLIVHANDGDASAVKAIRKGATANGIAPGRLQVTEGDAHILLAARRFDVVDLDPCGSPAPFLDAAMRSVRHGGLLCATATDTGALAGKFPRVCRRRYDAHHGLHKAPWRAEVGLRILAGALVRSAARFERSAVPVLAIASGHWMRVVAQVEDGPHGDAAVRRLGNAAMDDATGNGRFLAQGESAADWAGPLWTGPLHDAGLLAGMAEAAGGKTLARPKETLALVELLRQEVDAPAFWIVPDRLQKRFRPPAPRRDAFMQRLRDAGFKAARSHLEPQGIRTDADL